MAKQRYINTKIWEDLWFSNLDQIEQLVFIYFLTNPMTNIIGAYELSKKTISVSTGLENRTLNEILNRFKKDKKVFYIDGWVVISNFIKHQNYKSPKIIKGIERELKDVPTLVKKHIKIPKDLYGIDTVSHSNTNTNTNSNTNSNSNINTKEYNIAGKPAEKNKINQLMDIFYQSVNPTINWGNKTQRKALDELIKKLGFDKCKRTIEYAVKVQGQQYAPTITTPIQLKNKLGDLGVYWKKNNTGRTIKV